MISSATGTIDNALSGFGKNFHAFLGAIEGTIKWVIIPSFLGGAAFIIF